MADTVEVLQRGVVCPQCGAVIHYTFHACPVCGLAENEFAAYEGKSGVLTEERTVFDEWLKRYPILKLLSWSWIYMFWRWKKKGPQKKEWTSPYKICLIGVVSDLEFETHMETEKEMYNYIDYDGKVNIDYRDVDVKVETCQLYVSYEYAGTYYENAKPVEGGYLEARGGKCYPPEIGQAVKLKLHHEVYDSCIMGEKVYI